MTPAKPRTAPGILARLADGVVLGDGGYILELERRGWVQAGPFSPEVAVERPEALLELHLEFLRAGSEVLQALTFYGSRDKLDATGRGGRTVEINRAAVRLARQAAAGQALVAGGITLTSVFRPGSDSARRATRALMAEQVEVQAAEGVDLFVGETFVHLEEAEIALEVLRATGLPVMITLNIGPAGSRDGATPEECARRLAGEGADVVGVNCSYDPRVALAVAGRMLAATDAWIACQPVAFRTPDPDVPFTRLPEFPLALDRCQLDRFTFGRFAAAARAAGIRYVGGCCGVGAHHVRAMAEALGRRPEASAKSPALGVHVIPEVRERADPDYWQRLAEGVE